MSYEFPVTIDKDILSQYREELEYTNQEIEMLAIDLEKNPDDIATVEQIRHHIQEAWMSSVKLDLVPLSESLADSLKGLDLLLDWQFYPPAMTEFILSLLDRLMIIACEVEDKQFIDMRKTQAILVALQYIILAKDFSQINQGIETAIVAINQDGDGELESDNKHDDEIMLFDDGIELFSDDATSSSSEPMNVDIFVPEVLLNPMLQVRDFIHAQSIEKNITILAGSFDHAIIHQRSHINFLAELALASNLLAGSPLDPENLYSGICLHDVAMLPMAELLSKPGGMTSDDIEQLKLHPVNSAEVANVLDLPSEVIEMILHHHERIDGSGYPFGLSKDHISEMGKLLAIVDTFHGTMEKFSQQSERTQVLQAIIEVNRHAGSCFDQTWLEYFNRTIRDYWLPDWRAERRKMAS